jgi:hypothetical protein
MTSGSSATRIGTYLQVFVGVVLLLTAIAKIVSAFGTAEVLILPDPIFGVEFRHLFIAVALIEIGVALLCILGKSQTLNAVCIAWLASSFVFYRLGLKLVGYRKPCGCLGSLEGAIHLSSDQANVLLKIIIAFMFASSCAILVLESQKRSSRLTTSEAAS